MEFKAPSSLFLGHVQKMQSVVERRNTIPILLNIYLRAEDGGIGLTATDLDVGIRDRFEAEVLDPGSITLSAKKLFEILKELPDDLVTFRTTDSSWVEIACGQFQTRIMGLPPDDYPEIPDYSAAEMHVLDASVLEQMIERTAYAISQDENRYVLNGVLANWGSKISRMVATDGHRLSMVEWPGEIAGGLEIDTVLSAKCLRELRRMLREADGEMAFGVLGSHLVFRRGQEHLIARTVEGQFPDYRQVMPTRFGVSLPLSRDRLLSVLRRVSLLADQKNRGIRLEFRPGVLEVMASAAEFGTAREELPVEYDGPKVLIGFNAGYLLDAIRVIEGDQLMIEFNDPSSPAQIRPAGDAPFIYRAVVMPMIL